MTNGRPRSPSSPKLMAQPGEYRLISLRIVDLSSSTLKLLVKFKFFLIISKHTSVRASIPKKAILAPSLA